MKKIIFLPLIGIATIGCISTTMVSCKKDEKIHETWGEEQAHIIDGKTVKICTDLETCKICAETGDIVTDSGETYARNTFNLPVHLNPNLTHIPNCFLTNCISFNQTVNMPDTIEEIGNYFLASQTDGKLMIFNKSLNFSSNLTKIGDAFLEQCSTFNQPINLHNKLEIIGVSFMKACAKFNKQLVLPNTLTKIGDRFLRNCDSFNQSLTLPDSLTKIGALFLAGCNSMCSSINIQNLSADFFGNYDTNHETLTTTNKESPMIQTGIKIIGVNREAFLERFPNSFDKTPYRNLK